MAEYGKRKCKQCSEVFNKRAPLDMFCCIKCNILYKKEKDKKKDKSPTPIPKFSNKRSKQEAAYNVACKVFKMKAENKYCPVMSKLKGTTVLTTDVHHINGRENEMLLDQEFWLAVSREGHSYIHANTDIAREEGWLI